MAFLSSLRRTLVALSLFLSPALAAAEPWQVALTAQQGKSFAEWQRMKTPSAFAISPDGAWGFSEGFATDKAAQTAAMGWCQERLRPGRRDCILFGVNGRQVAPAQVETRKVTQVYKPVDGRKAAAFFGLAGLDFAGNRAAALAQLAQVQAGTDPSIAFGRDRGVEAIVANRSLMLAQSGGFALWLDGAGWAEQASKAQSGVLTQVYPQWMATREGLVCLFGGYFRSTGKKTGTNCLILNGISRGQVDFSWGGSSNVRRKGYLVAGDGRRGAAR
ncbi:hypothetical protein [Mesobacterium pallidum]|uniref:hypothetical protein n=1 Tax=Mesobacterium pallidum TaxID=2872037 RepID=UPI001EE38D12|nr:hypothetical protein [Mesobacterium pallidum]